MNSFSLFSKGQLVKIPSEYSSEYEGNTKKNLEPILVLSPPLSEKERKLALKIVASIGKDTEKELSFVELQEGEIFNPVEYTTQNLKLILSFGISAKRTGWDIENIEYQWQKIESFRILIGDDLTAIGQSRMLKQKLWSELKKITSDG